MTREETIKRLKELGIENPVNEEARIVLAGADLTRADLTNWNVQDWVQVQLRVLEELRQCFEQIGEDIPTESEHWQYARVRQYQQQLRDGFHRGMLFHYMQYKDALERLTQGDPTMLVPEEWREP